MRRAIVYTSARQQPDCLEVLAMTHIPALAFPDGVALLATQLEVGDTHSDGELPGVVVALKHPAGSRFVMLTSAGARQLIAVLIACTERVEAAAGQQVSAQLAAAIARKGQS